MKTWAEREKMRKEAYSLRQEELRKIAGYDAAMESMGDLLAELRLRDTELTRLLMLASAEGRSDGVNRLTAKIAGLRIAIDLVQGREC